MPVSPRVLTNRRKCDMIETEDGKGREGGFWPATLKTQGNAATAVSLIRPLAEAAYKELAGLGRLVGASPDGSGPGTTVSDSVRNVDYYMAGLMEVLRDYEETRPRQVQLKQKRQSAVGNR